MDEWTVMEVDGEWRVTEHGVLIGRAVTRRGAIIEALKYRVCK